MSRAEAISKRRWSTAVLTARCATPLRTGSTIILKRKNAAAVGRLRQDKKAMESRWRGEEPERVRVAVKFKAQHDSI
jgi:hypothetical protein